MFFAAVYVFWLYINKVFYILHYIFPTLIIVFFFQNANIQRHELLPCQLLFIQIILFI